MRTSVVPVSARSTVEEARTISPERRVHFDPPARATRIGIVTSVGPLGVQANRVALVTGGSVRIGRAISSRLAMNGYSVAVHTRSANDRTASFVGEIRKSGGKAAMIDGDLVEADAARSLIGRAGEELGSVSLLVNNASVFEEDDIETLGGEAWNRHFSVNLGAPAILIGEMAKNLPADKEGSVVNIIDQRVWKPNPQFISYTLSKSALWTLTRTASQALAPRIRVNAVGPGPTLSNARQSDRDFKKQYEGTLLQRPVGTDDIADAVFFLSQAKSVTGQMIAVDSGQHLAWRTPDIDGVNE